VQAGGKTFRSGCAALATGKHNLRGWPRDPGAMTAFKVQLSLTPHAARALGGIVQLASYRGGYIGACTVEDGNATICWLLDARRMRELGPDWRVHLAYIARQSSAVGDLLAGAHFLSARPAAVSGIPYGYRRSATIAPNVFPVGDQIAVIPSFTGDGTSLALSSGVAAAQAVLGGRPAGAFQREFLARTRAQFLWARGLDATFKSELSRTFSVAAIAALPSLAGLVASRTRLKGIDALTGPMPQRGYSSSTTK